MVIVIFTESYYPYNCGVTEAVQNLADNLRALGFVVYIVTPDYPNYSCGGDWVIRIPSYHIKERNYCAAWPVFSKDLVEKIAALKPNIVHSHGPYATHRLAAIIAKKLHIPFVMTWHTLVVDYMECWMKGVKLPNPIIKLAAWLAKKIWIKPLCQWADLILAPTNFVKDMLGSYKIRTEIQVLPLAINLEIPKPDPAEVEKLRASLGIDPNDQVLLYVGRVTPEKNIDKLLEVFRRILCVRKDYHLVIVGGGDKDKVVVVGKGKDKKKINYHELAHRLGIPSNKISFIGEVPREQTPYYYQMARLSLLASITDNSPRAILEAMACGLPVVAVRAGGVPDLVIDGQTGILVEPDDIANSMAKAALQILGSPILMDQMRQLARVEVMSDKYKPPFYAQEVVGIYQQLIERRT